MVEPESSTTSQASEEAPGAGTRLAKPELVKKMQGLFNKYEGDRKHLVLIRDALNAERILSPNGKVWQTHTVRDFLKKNVKGVKPSSKEKPTSEKPARKRKEAAEEAAEPTPSLQPQKTLLLDDYRPRFRKDIKRDQESIRLSVELVNRAKQRLRNDVPRSGETIRELIELLLWHYLDRPEEFLWMHQGKKW